MSRPLRWSAAGLALGALTVFGLRACRSPEERFADALEEAREDFVEGRDAEFLARFDDAVAYRGRKGSAELRADLAAWRTAGIGGARVLDKEIRAVDGDGSGGDGVTATGTATLTAEVGPALRPVGRVTVRLSAEERGGGWFVTAFDWN